MPVENIGQITVRETFNFFSLIGIGLCKTHLIDFIHRFIMLEQNKKSKVKIFLASTIHTLSTETLTYGWCNETETFFQPLILRNDYKCYEQTRRKLVTKVLTKEISTQVDRQLSLHLWTSACGFTAVKRTWNAFFLSLLLLLYPSRKQIYNLKDRAYSKQRLILGDNWRAGVTFCSKKTFLQLIFFFFFFADVESAFRSGANTDALLLDKPVSLLLFKCFLALRVLRLRIMPFHLKLSSPFIAVTGLSGEDWWQWSLKFPLTVQNIECLSQKVLRPTAK